MNVLGVMKDLLTDISNGTKIGTEGGQWETRSVASCTERTSVINEMFMF